MKRLIAGATGFIGQKLVQGWLDAGISVVVIGRSKEKISKVFGGKAEARSWDELSELDSAEIEFIVNLAGAGIADQRWSPSRKKEILQSRVDATNILSDFCSRQKIPLLNASAVGIYGVQEQKKEGLPSPLDENMTPGGEPGDFLSYVCRQWEDAATKAKEAGCRVVHLRLGVVLGKGGGALEKMALPFHLFAGGPIGSGRQPVPWIALDDVCGAVNHLIANKEIAGHVNLVAPGCVTQKQLAKALGTALNRPSLMPTPGFMLKLILGDMAQELLLEGQHVVPKVLSESGYRFNYPDIDSALKEIYS